MQQRSRRVNALRRSFQSYAFGWPWFDPFSAWALKRFFVPTSLLWAAAERADSSVMRFCQEAGIAVPSANQQRLKIALQKFTAAERAANALEMEWQRHFFGNGERSNDELQRIETARHDAAHAFYATRRHFAFLLRSHSPAIDLKRLLPQEVDAQFSDAALDVSRIASNTRIEFSRKIERSHGNDFWLRFRSPAPRLNDIVYARVYEPAAAVNPPTVIFGHGISIEHDHWRGLIDEAHSLRRAGFRVIRPEAPGHGRRRERGRFGGERQMTEMPAGLFDTFMGARAEWVVLADWARRTSNGPLAFGGTSLGALTAQYAACKARGDGKRLRPDGLFLITHCGRMVDATLYGEMAQILRITPEAASRGWTIPQLEAAFARLDPASQPSVPPAQIITVLGKRDRVTPFRSGIDLIDRWGVPEENRFIWDRGHFSMPLTMIRNPEPVERFRDAMIRCQG